MLTLTTALLATPWEHIGPWNIGDDIHIGGESGTLSSAASPVSNPNLIYAGGKNNGASSGVLKSVDMGRHWKLSSHGMFNTAIESLYIHDDKGDHLFCGTDGGIYESTDAAASWTLIKETQAFGVCKAIVNGTIAGVPTILAGCEGGVANRPAAGGNWSLIKSPPGVAAWRSNYLSVSDALGSTSVVAGCLWPDHVSGVVTIGTLLNTTHANWTLHKKMHGCTTLAIDPNDHNRLLVNNNSNGLHAYECLVNKSAYGGLSCHYLGHRGLWHTAIDRKGWYYSAAEQGAFRSMDRGKTWQPYFVRRVQRRTNRTVDRVPHDYQRIQLDFAGTVSFPSDQGLFIKNMSNLTSLQLYSANGDMNNNIAIKVAVAKGDDVGGNYLVTSAWDWAPLASWDGGKHWPSWQTKADGAAPGYIGEGGGAYALGNSNHVLMIHHHNIGYSHQGGKNFSRFVLINSGSVGYPAYGRKEGTRVEPNGQVYAPATMADPPWEIIVGKAVRCEGKSYRGDLGLHTNYSCAAAVDFGVQYGWYKGVNYGVWRGDGSKHCYICELQGNSSEWHYEDDPGAVSFQLKKGFVVKEPEEVNDGWYTHDEADYEDADDEDEDDDKDGDDDDDDDDDREWTLEDYLGFDNGVSDGSAHYLLRSANFGQNWTYVRLPVKLQPINGFSVDPTDPSLVYAVAANCIASSKDNGETWGECFNLTGTFKELVIKDSKTMIAIRSKAVPLRTLDGGATWHELTSCASVAGFTHSAQYSWTGKTLVLHGSGGKYGEGREHAGYVWVSTDDGTTWKDETGDLITMAVLSGQWFEGKFYLNTAGQGIVAKVFE